MFMANTISNKVLARILRSGKFVGWCKEMASVVRVFHCGKYQTERYEADQLVDRTLSGVG